MTFIIQRNYDALLEYIVHRISEHCTATGKVDIIFY